MSNEQQESIPDNSAGAAPVVLKNVQGYGFDQQRQLVNLNSGRRRLRGKCCGSLPRGSR